MSKKPCHNARTGAQISDVYKRDVYVTSWRFHNRTWNDWWIVIRFNLRATCCYLLGLPRVISAWPLSKMTTAQKEPTETSVQEIYHNNHMAAFLNWTSLSFNCANLFWSRSIETWHCLCQLDNIPQYIIWSTCGLNKMATCLVSRLRTTLKFWSATMFGAAARNFGLPNKFEPTVIADSVPRATRIFSLASVGHVTGHMVSHMVPIARCRPPYWNIFTVNNLATVF